MGLCLGCCGWNCGKNEVSLEDHENLIRPQINQDAGTLVENPLAPSSANIQNEDITSEVEVASDGMSMTMMDSPRVESCSNSTNIEDTDSDSTVSNASSCNSFNQLYSFDPEVPERNLTPLSPYEEREQNELENSTGGSSVSVPSREPWDPADDQNPDSPNFQQHSCFNFNCYHSQFSTNVDNRKFEFHSTVTNCTCSCGRQRNNEELNPSERSFGSSSSAERSIGSGSVRESIGSGSVQESIVVGSVLESVGSDSVREINGVEEHSESSLIEENFSNVAPPTHLSRTKSNQTFSSSETSETQVQNNCASTDDSTAPSFTNSQTFPKRAKKKALERRSVLFHPLNEESSNGACHGENPDDTTIPKEINLSEDELGYGRTRKTGKSPGTSASRSSFSEVPKLMYQAHTWPSRGHPKPFGQNNRNLLQLEMVKMLPQNSNSKSKESVAQSSESSFIDL